MKIAIFVACISLWAVSALCSDYTNSEKGIHSTGLGLDGTGVKIGQEEPTRPGKLPLDTASKTDASIAPTAVFVQDQPATHDTGLDVPPDFHAEAVAGVMISSDANGRKGVATNASLYSAAAGDNASDNVVAITLQQLAIDQQTHIINKSSGIPGGTHPMDGNNLLTLFQDWSASQPNQDVLYIDAGSETGKTNLIPTDNFNGMVIARSVEADDGVYRLVDPGNVLNTPVLNGKSSYISLIAPGVNVAVRGPSGEDGVGDGTSFSAPMVSGTAALLQQYANINIRLGVRGWNADALHHQVMKAVLLNSADKIKDDGTFILPGLTTPVPQGYLLGMEKTVIRANPDPNTNMKKPYLTWFDSPAADKSIDTGGLMALDPYMGAGALNASRAVKQFAAGEFHAAESGGPATVPVIGWDYGHSVSTGDTHTYTFNQNLQGGSFISMSLAYDRVVNLVDVNSNGRFDIGEAFSPSSDPVNPGHDMFSDLDIYLIDTNTFTQVANSIDPTQTVDHIFWQIPTTDPYEIEIKQANMNAGAVNYALAWWALGTGPLTAGAGDINQDGHVDLADIVAMEKALADETDFANQDGISTDELALIGDVNGDGKFTNADLQSLIGLLQSGGGSTSVPEPVSAMLLALGAVACVCARKAKSTGCGRI